MGLLEELKQQRAESLQRLEDHQKLAVEWQQNADIEQARIADLDRAIAALQPGALTEDERAVREVNAYVGGVADGYQQAIAAWITSNPSRSP